jgi:serine/threonine protein kinase
MSRKLVVVDGPDAGRTISLDKDATLLVGRGQASNTRLNDPRISRKHCVFEVGPHEVLLTDAGSTGGTFVGGRKIAKHRLAHGDEIQIGDSRLRFESEQSSSERNATANSKADRSHSGKPRLSGSSIQDLVGQTLGHFKLEHIAHVGGASILFRGQDQKHTRPAMIKVMLPTVTSDEDQRHRFVRAVHTMINVRHDNLVEIYGAGKQGPFCWCAMEFVDGISILEIIELVGTQGRLDWREVYRVGLHVARALECAHRQKVIHRNVTPENLIQRKNDKVVKLCDLMLAKALEGTQARQVTAPGQLIGNVAYMSPERMVDTSSLDWRSDQYGLGATLYALLTGHPPFEANSLPELVKAVRNDAPSFPDEVRQEANAEFLQIVLKMLGKTPDDRFAFTSQLTNRLDEIGKQYDVDADVLYNN